MRKVRDITMLSWTQVNLYRRCPLAWAKRYLDKIRPPKAQPLCFGIAFHTGIEAFLTEWKVSMAEDICIANACSVFDDCYTFGEDRGPNPKRWLPVGNRMIKALCENLIEKRVVPRETEALVKKGGFLGKVDAIVELENGKRLVVDWKTAGRPYTKARVANDGQLTGYSYLTDCSDVAFVVVLKSKPHKVLWYPTTRSDAQVRSFLEDVEQVRLELETCEKFLGVHRESICKWCDYNDPQYCRGTRPEARDMTW